jgi:hypothetical protein
LAFTLSSLGKIDGALAIQTAQQTHAVIRIFAVIPDLSASATGPFGHPFTVQSRLTSQHLAVFAHRPAGPALSIVAIETYLTAPSLAAIRSLLEVRNAAAQTSVAIAIPVPAFIEHVGGKLRFHARFLRLQRSFKRKGTELGDESALSDGPGRAVGLLKGTHPLNRCLGMERQVSLFQGSESIRALAHKYSAAGPALAASATFTRPPTDLSCKLLTVLLCAQRCRSPGPITITITIAITITDGTS